MGNPLSQAYRNMDISRLVTSVAGVSRNGILTPLLMLCAFISLPALIIGPFTSGYFQLLCIYVVSLPVSVTVIIFIIFSIFSPNRLHSEQYQISAQAYRLLGDERLTPEAVQAVIDNVPAIMNPQQKMLSHGGEA